MRGLVVRITTDGAAELNDRLAKKYMGVETFPFDVSDQTRVAVTIRPEKIYVYGLTEAPPRAR